MKTLIVYSHPHHNGHHGYFLEQLLLILLNKKIEYEVLDLYALSFDPVLKAEEIIRGENFVTDVLIKNFQDKITEAEKLIFIFPVWWQNMPAILKGFFDRVFSGGFAFRYKKSGLPEGLLTGKRAAVFSATGSPKIVNKLIFSNRAMKIVIKDILSFCGIKAKGYSIGSARTLNDKNKKEIIREVSKVVDYLYKL